MADQEAPGFNITAPAGLGFNIVPTWADVRGQIAETLGMPVDGAGWVLHKMGFQIPRDLSVLVGTATPSRGTWFPAASVPFSSAFFREGMDAMPGTAGDWLQVLKRAGIR